MAKDKLRVYYHDPGCILVINPRGEIRKLYTPFRVLCVESVNKWIKEGTWFFVDEVKTAANDKLIFVIAGTELPYHYFRIQINF